MTRPTATRPVRTRPLAAGATHRLHRRLDRARAAPLLDEARLAALRGVLVTRRDFRVEQLASLDRQRGRGPISSAHREVYVSLAVGARTALQEVQSALLRMDAGRYGLCTTCGTRLDPAVLEALPQTARCLPCHRAALEADQA